MMNKNYTEEVMVSKLKKEEGVSQLQHKGKVSEMPVMPYKTYLSFGPLIDFMKSVAKTKGLEEFPIYKLMQEFLEQAPELNGPIEDMSILEKHKELVNVLVNAVLPPVAQHFHLAKLSEPFKMKSFFETDAVKDLFKNHKAQYEVSRSADMLPSFLIVSAGSLILNRFYNQNLKITPPVLISAEAEGRRRYFRFNMDPILIEVKKLKPLKPLSQEQINDLISNIYDSTAWLEAMPADSFAFEGFNLSNLIEITEEESLSRLKQALLEQDAIVTQENVLALENLTRNYLNVPGLKLGITALDYPKENAIAHKYKIRFNFLASEVKDLLDEQYSSSIYHKAIHYKEVLLIEDLTKKKDLTSIERQLLNQGIRSIIIAPLLNSEKKIIGMLEIGAPKSYGLHSFTELKFRDIIGLFNIAMERSRGEIDNQIEAIIREQFTDIHPSVEWRFIEASYNLLEKREAGEPYAMIEPIAFNEVYPLYGQADIVGSSNKRNTAIQLDLLENLDSVKKLLAKTADIIPFPLLKKYIMDVDHAKADLEAEFNSNDETRIVDLLHRSVHPTLRTLQRQYPEIDVYVNAYFDTLDKDLEVIYKKRKAYEDSVTLIRTAIGDYLDKQDKESQSVLPHFFTKYKTDGVEYDIYVGKSLLKSDQFCIAHLQNFRLQQLVDMVNITKLVSDMQSNLPEPLTTAQLVFAYTNTLSIRFREDEKQFDVDGAYNVRYEILKKRIDKAVIDGTDERLTQGGKVAIVYLQDKDRAEYIEYIKYLDHEGLIEGEIEDLTLGKLQGAQGLKALRFTVKCLSE